MNLFVVFGLVAFCYLQNWVHVKSGHQHELLMFDALDRIFRAILIVLFVWLAVGFALHLLWPAVFSASPPETLP